MSTWDIWQPKRMNIKLEDEQDPSKMAALLAKMSRSPRWKTHRKRRRRKSLKRQKKRSEYVRAKVKKTHAPAGLTRSSIASSRALRPQVAFRRRSVLKFASSVGHQIVLGGIAPLSRSPPDT